MSEGAPLDEVDDRGWTPLFHAVRNLRFPEVELPALEALLAAGANVNHRARDAATPLLTALSCDPPLPEVVAALLNAGAADDAAAGGGRTARALVQELDDPALRETLLAVLDNPAASLPAIGPTYAAETMPPLETAVVEMLRRNFFLEAPTRPELLPAITRLREVFATLPIIPVFPTGEPEWWVRLELGGHGRHTDMVRFKVPPGLVRNAEIVVMTHKHATFRMYHYGVYVPEIDRVRVGVHGYSNPMSPHKDDLRKPPSAEVRRGDLWQLKGKTQPQYDLLPDHEYGLWFWVDEQHRPTTVYVKIKLRPK